MQLLAKSQLLPGPRTDAGSNELPLYTYLKGGFWPAREMQRLSFLKPSAGFPHVWLSPDKIEAGETAAHFLSLPFVPEVRVGPLQVNASAVVYPLRRVEPAYGRPGGGWEMAAKRATATASTDVLFLEPGKEGRELWVQQPTILGPGGRSLAQGPQRRDPFQLRAGLVEFGSAVQMGVDIFQILPPVNDSMRVQQI